MWNHGDDIGLYGEALRMFSFAACEVRLTLEVDSGTGEAKIVAVDGREIATDA
jgi:hypothetical protein